MFTEILTAVIILFLLVGAWLNFFKEMGKLVWLLRIPITVAAIIFFLTKIFG